MSRPKTKSRWIQLAPGVSQKPPTKAAAALHRERQVKERQMQARIDADTRGLGRWTDPEGWGSTPFSHTVTLVDGLSCGTESGWNIYNGSVVVALVVHPTDTAFERGQPYVWCKTVREFSGDTYPTSPIFGRFIEKDRSGRPIALVGRGKSEVIDEKHDQCFRAVGRVGHGKEFYQRSELPVPVPGKAIRYDQPLGLEAIQDLLDDLRGVIEAALYVTELVKESDNAEKAAKGKVDSDSQRWREARAFQSLCPILAEALNWQSQVHHELDNFLEASPSLAYWLKEIQAERKQKGIA